MSDGLLAGGGEVGALLRAFDWSTCPVGHPSTWPHSLRVVMRILLTSRYAMWLGWGPGFTFFYNDAYARMSLGARHPWALGRPASEVWSEIWSEVGPRAEGVLRTGEATWDERLQLFVGRRGFLEETYHTFSYSPVPDDLGGVGGMLCVVTEETGRVIDERRLRSLRELAAATVRVRSPEAACTAAVRSLADNSNDLPFTLVYLDGDQKHFHLVAATGVQPGSPVAPRIIPADHPYARVITDRTAITVDDLSARFGPVHAGPWPEPLTTARVVPLAQSGQDDHLTGIFVAGVSPRRPFDADYVGFLDLVAGHVTSAVAEALARAAEKRRSEQLAELDRAKTTFFSNVSHELRTPLTLLLGPLGDVLASPAMRAEHRELLALSHRNALRLQKLVNTLLDFSRIEAGRVRATYEPTDLAEFTAELASNFRSACERAGLTLTVDCRPLAGPVHVDRELWEKIVLNLLSNAFKFTLAGGITVTVAQAGEAATLTVRDTGAGIPEDQLPRVFERFHRVEGARARTHEGTGIGLSLVQELVKLHGGGITVDSVHGEGSTFTVTIPLGSAHLPQDRLGARPPAPPRPHAAAAILDEVDHWLPPDHADSLADEHPTSLFPGDDPDAPRVLLADDNADMRAYVGRLLAPRYNVTAVADGAQALAAVRAHRPDLVLSDVMMPGLDGFGLLTAIRADPTTAAIPVILLSARAGEEATVDGLAAGADEYLIKPFSARELLARVSGLLALATVRRDAEHSIKISEERLRLLDAIGEATRTAADPIAVMAATTRVLGTYLGTTRCAYADVEPDSDHFTIRNDWTVPGVPSSAGYYSLALFGPRAVADLHAGQILVVRDVDEELGDNAGGAMFNAIGIKAIVCCPLVKDDRLVALMAVHQDTPRDWQPREVALVAEVVERSWAHIERVRAEATLRDQDRRKDEFLATLAHELRNPLAPLRSGLEILRMTPAGAPAAVRTREMMERQLVHMVLLIDDLLDISRVSRGKIDLKRERLELRAVIDTALETSRPLLTAARHRLALRLPDEPLWLDADPTRLAQIVDNLLNNAAKFTPDGGDIELAVRRVGELLELRVTDSGEGIATDMLPRVFDLFVQGGRAPGRAHDGLGIGLSIVKKLTELHGGTIDATSPGPGLGSTFVVRLPLATPERTPTPAPAPAAPARASRRVLVVDDNVDGAVSLAMMLELSGHTAQVAHDGHDALSMARASVPEVALLDIGMPGMSGYELARRFRDDPALRHVKLVALTGWGSDDDKRLALAAGFDHHLTKPVDARAVAEQLTRSTDPSAWR